MKSIHLLMLSSLFLASCSSLNILPSGKLHNIEFIDETTNLACEFVFPNAEYDSTLLEMNTRYGLQGMIKDQSDGIEKAKIILNWTSNRWEHNGGNVPKSHDPIYLIEEGKKGEKFRCVEYGVVLSAAMNTVGMPTRTLALKTKDVEKVKLGAGHVVSEAYIPGLRKWVFMDAQLDYIPFLGNTPLNAIEFQKAIVEKNKSLELRNKNGVIQAKRKRKIIKFVGKYLYYFDARFDQTKNRETCQDKAKLMLVPIGADFPRVFQRENAIDYCHYTRNVNEFYKAPIIQ